jgi:hypothetical protein
MRHICSIAKDSWLGFKQIHHNFPFNANIAVLPLTAVPSCRRESAQINIARHLPEKWPKLNITKNELFEEE